MNGRGNTPETIPQQECVNFRESFPEFADPVKWPDAVIARNHETAACSVSPTPGKRLSGPCRALAVNLMTAHLLFLEDAIMNGKGGTPGLVTGASVDKVSVSLTPPPVKSQFAWWLSLSPRGAQLLALLRTRAAGGMYVGGMPPERAAFRKAGGVFISGKGRS